MQSSSLNEADSQLFDGGITLLPFEDGFIAPRRAGPAGPPVGVHRTLPGCSANFFSVCQNYYHLDYLYRPKKKDAVSQKKRAGNF